MLRLMTLNVGSLFEPDWVTRRHEVVAQILDSDADIVCLQEVWRESETVGTTRWLVEALADAGHDYHFCFGGHAFGAFGEQNPDFRFGSAILSRWLIDEDHVWSLPTAEDPHDPIPAMMPWELVHARTAGLDIFTTHLAPAPSHGRHRKLQVLEIDKLIRETRGELDAFTGSGQRVPMPAILTGDFNAEPESDEIRFLKGLRVFNDRTTFFQDAWAVAGDDGPGYTSDWRTHELSAMLNIHRKRIDYVFVGDPFRRVGDAGRVLDCRVVATEPLTGVQASDHRGLVVEIEWPTRPAG